MSSVSELVAMAFDKTPRTSDDSKIILNRALELGMDPVKDANLFWIAEQSWKAKLPDDWMECQTEEGHVYYYNLRDEQSIWEHPTLNHYKELYQKVKQQKAAGSEATKSIPKIEEKKVSKIKEEKVNEASKKKTDRSKAEKDSESDATKQNSSLPVIAPKDSFQSDQHKLSPRSNSVDLLRQKHVEKNNGDAYFWRTRYESKEAEVTKYVTFYILKKSIL